MKPSMKVTTIGRSAPNMGFSIKVVLDHLASQFRCNAKALRVLSASGAALRESWRRARARASGLCSDRILSEKLSDQSRVEISANAHDLVGLEKENPTVTIVEPHAVPSRRQRM